MPDSNWCATSLKEKCLALINVREEAHTSHILNAEVKIVPPDANTPKGNQMKVFQILHYHLVIVL